MSQKEFQRVKVIENAVGGRLSVREAVKVAYPTCGRWLRYEEITLPY
ncbi:MAG TPA: hypothetical protein VLA42_17415 [Verrucomicrobiae bacterium]|jgi:hypothetical protein|nr:hypothetical protein [Verrucomicrobiae bacterium]